MGRSYIDGKFYAIKFIRKQLEECEIMAKTRNLNKMETKQEIKLIEKERY